jgi:hypothetical protein
MNTRLSSEEVEVEEANIRRVDGRVSPYRSPRNLRV